MNFLEYKERVEEKDTVILCRGYEKMFPVRVERGKVIQVKGGAIHHDSLIGKPYGMKVETSNGKNWVLLLHPTPELWTLSLPHRTQIIYSTDTAFITLSLGLRPGSKVIESGTGSGALSHALARSVAPNGHLYTFEFHEQRKELAREEFYNHGMGDVVTLECRDVCKDGFAMMDQVDAVFLDLPRPWEAIQSARTAMKGSGGRVCSFSPCMEQVQRTCNQLQELGFSDIEVVETLLKSYEVKQHTLALPNLGVEGEWKVGVVNTMWTGQVTNRIPGHTGYLTMATLHYK